MASKTKIEWTDATWSPITGCSIVSPGCTNCYAMGLAGTRLKHHWSRKGLTKQVNGNHVWTGEVRFNEKWLTQPLHWRKPRMIFVCAHSDLFHEDVPYEWIDRVFAVMALCPQHTFQVLTKRPERMNKYIVNLLNRDDLVAHAAITFWGGKNPDAVYDDVMRVVRMPLPNVWLGVSVEDQKTADERIPFLLDTPAAIRFVSAEPLLGPIDLESAWHSESAFNVDCWGDCNWCSSGKPPLHNCMMGKQTNEDYERAKDGLDWVIVGGESGHKARPMDEKWAISIRDQCKSAGVPFFMKQMARKAQIPEHLMVREMPNAG